MPNVDLQLLCYLKNENETTTRLQTLEESTGIDTTDNKKHSTVFTLDYDDVSNPVALDDVLSMRLNFETDTSTISNIVINSITIQHKKA